MAIRLNVTENTPYYIGARAYVTQTADGAILTVVDKEGVTTATILNGINGRSIASCTLNDDYTLTVLYTDGTSDTTASIRGAQGVSGVWVGDEAPTNPDYNVWVDPTNEDGAVLKVKDDDTWETIDTIVGEPAGFGTVTATADINVGTPSVTVTSSGENTAKNFAFAFHNLGYDDSDLQSDMGVLEARMDSFTNLAEGSTTGDAELIDGRVGADGVTYNNIGTAIRTQVSDLKSELNFVGELVTVSTTKIDAYFNGWYLTPTGGTTFLIDLQEMTGDLYIKTSNSNRFRYGFFTDAFSSVSSAKIAQAFTDAGNSNTTLMLEPNDYSSYKTLALHIATPYSNSVVCSVENFQTKESLQDEIDDLQNQINTLTDKTVIISNPIGELYNAKDLDGVQTHNGQVPLATVYQNWDDLVTTYPNFMTGYRLGTDTTGTYDINVYTISSKNNVSVGNATVDHDSNKHLKVLWISSIHGDEANTTNEDYCFFKDLLENHSTKDSLGVLWDNVDFIIVPVANPWGYVNLSRFNSNSVNLNRNFPYNWQHIDQEQDPYNYGGEAPNDQKETQLLVGLVNANLDTYIAVNRHGTATFTAGNVIGYIWSAFERDRRTAYGSFRPVDTLLKDTYSWIVGDKASNANNNILTVQDNVVYGGTLDGWFNNSKKIHGFLLELGSSAGTDYPNYTAKDYHEMCITTIGNLLASFAVNNGFIWSDTDPS